MPSSKYTGSPMGSGNPPGKHSPGYLKSPGKGEGHFNQKKSYRGSMHVGINERATEGGNQPREKKTTGLEKHANGPALR